MLKKTPLNEWHKKQGAKMVPFSGWEMPIQYHSILEEHQQVRQKAGMFDVSHMCAIDIQGSESKAFLRYLLANDIQKLTENGTALYSCLLNEDGGILDDLIVCRLDAYTYRLMVNAGTTEKDIHWIQTQALDYQIILKPRYDLAMLAIQGPLSISKIEKCFPADIYQQIVNLKPFTAIEFESWLITRTGYTGEQGIEVLLPREEIIDFWENLFKQSIMPIGLGARDTLRLEAGFNLYGQDMDEAVTPFDSNLAWTVDFKDEKRDFIGKKALEQQKLMGISKRLVGIVLKDKGILRPQMNVYETTNIDTPLGILTSGSFSPVLNKGIGLARIKMNDGASCWVDIRGKRMPADIIKLPFVKAGKATFNLLNNKDIE